ncbi:hypothetical protein [Mycolicibacterium sphagni]|uniref:hypothetical protein n=1 Tax=Mycolicibacterium sphagni TaxID=1786 RepID=UPI0021F33878|nr:hypothetical protein [Mycolicibacterium sphagni]
MYARRRTDRPASGKIVRRLWQTGWILWPLRMGIAVFTCLVVALAALQLQAALAYEFAGSAGAGDSAARLVAAASAAPQSRSGSPSPLAAMITATAAGPVPLVLPAGLGESVSTPDGVVVYPDAGLDVIADNTRTVVCQIRPGLYQVSVDIEPTPASLGPRYVDPPLQVAGTAPTP